MMNVMNARAAKVLAEALELTPEEREEVADGLYASLEGAAEPEVEKAWAEEIERRIQGVEDGTAKTIPLEEFLEKLRTRTRKAG